MRANAGIELDHVFKSYRAHGRDRPILRGISARFRRGDQIGILGRNGAGKSTLMRLISGVEFPTSGQVRRGMSVSWPIGFGGAFQSSLTGADNTRFIARIYGVSVERTLGFVQSFADLGEYFRMPVKTYSSGMQSRLGFALSLAVDFDCYILDEMTAVGDARFTERCREALAERAKRCTMLMVSHNPDNIRQFCKTAAILHGGHLSMHEDLDEAIARYEAL